MKKGIDPFIPTVYTAFLLVLLHISPLLGFSQSITGLWSVDQVTVGNRVVTPVAKWFRINEDGTVQSGNGWTQNNLATWTYDEKKQYFLPVNTLTAPDPFGGFHVVLKGSQMVWSRVEEGDSVYVTLSAAKELPMAPADSIQGIWELTSVAPASEIAAFEQCHIRPDRLYNLTKTSGEKEYGFWHMDGHAPKFFLICFDKSLEDKVYWVSFANNQLIMKEDKESTVLTFKRRLE